MRTVELTLDPALDDTVRAAWFRLFSAHLPSLSTHRGPTNAPHLTLAVAAGLPPGVAPLLAAALPLEAELSGLKIFTPSPVRPERRVVVWSVTPGEALRTLHAEVWAALDGVERNPMHAPGVWEPHVSLVLRATPEEADGAVTLLGPEATAHGSFVAARSFDQTTKALRLFP